MAYKHLSERLQYFAIEAHDPAHKGVSKALDRRLERALDEFYAELKSREELMAKFSSQQSIDNARKAQARHWKSAFADGITEVFRDRAGHIGQVHARIGLEPKWYVGSYARLLEHLVEEIIAPGWQRYLPWRRARVRQVNALLKVSLLDIELALSSYFFDLKGKVSAVNEGLGSALAKLAEGDLDIPPVKLPPEYHQIQGDFNSTIETLKTTIGAAIHNVASIRTGSAEIRSASNDLARRTEQQAANLEETASAIAETTQQTQEAAASTQLARKTITEANEMAKEGAGIVAEAVTAMDQIEKSSKQITDIISVIDAIAFQTNLLALNAGVEAARAGESGKGFAVVASEVRALAQRCTEAADQVKTLISASAQHVTAGVTLVQRSGDAFSAITQAVSNLSSSIEKIAESSEIQAARLSQINATVRDLDQSTQQNAAMAEQSNAAASSLAQQAERLRDSIGHFELSHSAPHNPAEFNTSLAA